MMISTWHQAQARLVKCPALIYIYESIQNVKNVLPVNPKKERVKILVTDSRSRDGGGRK
jgi:hypothetical protein